RALDEVHGGVHVRPRVGPDPKLGDVRRVPSGDLEPRDDLHQRVAGPDQHVAGDPQRDVDQLAHEGTSTWTLITPGAPNSSSAWEPRSRPRTGWVNSRSSHPGDSASVIARSRTPASTCS